MNKILEQTHKRMRILSFFGILASIGLFGLAAMMSMQYCYSWDCDCEMVVANRDAYVLISLFFAIFFLIYGVVFMFKITELKQIQRIDFSDKVLDANLAGESYTVFQLPMVQLLTKAGFVLSILLLLFTYFVTKITCVPKDAACNAATCGNGFSYDQELYLLGFGFISIYLLVLTLVGLLKSYPSKYQ